MSWYAIKFSQSINQSTNLNNDANFIPHQEQKKNINNPQQKQNQKNNYLVIMRDNIIR